MTLTPSDLALLRELPASTEPPRGIAADQRRRIEDLPWGLLRDGRRTDLGDDVVDMANSIAAAEAEKAALSAEVAALRVWVGHHHRDPQMLADAQHEHGLLSERVTDLQDENARLYDALETARLTLLAEQGKPEGAASERWRVGDGVFGFWWWRGEDDEPPEVECHSTGDGWRWTKPGFESNPYPTAMDCMNAADKDSP